MRSRLAVLCLLVAVCVSAVVLQSDGISRRREFRWIQPNQFPLIRLFPHDVQKPAVVRFQIGSERVSDASRQYVRIEVFEIPIGQGVARLPGALIPKHTALRGIYGQNVIGGVKLPSIFFFGATKFGYPYPSVIGGLDFFRQKLQRRPQVDIGCWKVAEILDRYSIGNFEPQGITIVPPGKIGDFCSYSQPCPLGSSKLMLGLREIVLRGFDSTELRSSLLLHLGESISGLLLVLPQSFSLQPLRPRVVQPILSHLDVLQVNGSGRGISSSLGGVGGVLRSSSGLVGYPDLINRDYPAHKRSNEQQPSEYHQPSVDLQLLLVKSYLRLGVFFLAFFSFALLSLYSLYLCFAHEGAALKVMTWIGIAGGTWGAQWFGYLILKELVR